MPQPIPIDGTRRHLYCRSVTPSGTRLAFIVNMATRPCRVLVVDDDKDTAQTLARLLVSMGQEATFLTDPTQVLETTNRVHPHIVFLDLGMPGLDGWTIARLLRKLYPQDGTLRLVAFSGRGDDEARKESRRAGFDAHVLKSVETGTSISPRPLTQFSARCDTQTSRRISARAWPKARKQESRLAD